MGNEINTDIVTTSDGKQYEKSGTAKAIVGSTAALGSVFASYMLSNKVMEKTGKSLGYQMLKIGDYNAKNNYKLSDSLMKMYNESGLKEKGVVLYDYKDGLTIDILNSWKLSKCKFKTIEEFDVWRQKNKKKYNSILKEVLEPKYDGVNSFAKNRSVHINMEETSAYALPHELGHVKNNMSKGLGKLTSFTNLKIAKANKFLMPLILATAILRDKKAEGEESTNVVGKGLDFVKDNCVALTAATQIPCLADEGLATLKGWKMVKKYVTPEEFKMIKTGNKKAYMTYLASAAAVTGAVFVANTIKNWISGPKEVSA